MNRAKTIAFDCPECREKLEISERAAGSTKTCPACSAPVKVPGREEKSTTVRMGLRGVAAMEAKVSKKDAGRMAHTFLGGLIALAAVIVCTLLGIRSTRS